LKKLLILLALVTLIGAAAAGCGNKDAENGDAQSAGDTSLTDITTKGELILGCDDSFPPMGFRDQNGEVVGFDIDLAQGVADKLGVDLVVKPINWSTKEMDLLNGNIDVIWNGYTITQERDLAVEFSKPYLNNEQVFVVRANSDINSVADFAGKLIGCQIDSAALSAINADPALLGIIEDLTVYDNYQDALLDLRISDRISVVAVDKVLINYEMTQLPGEYRVLDDVLAVEYYGIGMRKGSAALSQAIDDALDEMQDDGTTDVISSKWFGENIVIRDVEKLTQDELLEIEG
jgi:polar amino acid transport system substrate-binding protein